MTAQVIGFPPPTWDTWMEFPAPSSRKAWSNIWGVTHKTETLSLKKKIDNKVMHKNFIATLFTTNKAEKNISISCVNEVLNPYSGILCSSEK